ncbi:DUF418 domain-containing protein [Halocola ammonii]
MKNTNPGTAPIAENNRILYLDILRGIAILFIFLANIPYLSGTYFYSEALAASFPTANLDYSLKVFSFTLIDGKFYSIFSILFGIGFAVQYEKLKNGNRPFVPFFTRRMLGLLLIGSIHLVFFWPGDILTTYALIGLVLILFKDFSNRNLICWAIVLLLLPIVHWCFMYFTDNFYPYPLFGYVSQYGAKLGLIIPETAGTKFPMYDPGAQLATENFARWFEMQIRLPIMRLGLLLLEGRLFKILALFMIGIWAGRQILRNGLLENTALLKKITIWGLVIGIPFSVFRSVLEFGNFNSAFYTFLSYVLYAASVVPLACGYAAGIALIVKSRPKALKWFSPVGRTALSNYLFQTGIGMFIFYGIGLGFTQDFGFSIVLGIAILIFMWQIVFSTLWLKFFRFGPMEWIWRQMTYSKWVAIRKKKPLPEITAESPIARS